MAAVGGVAAAAGAAAGGNASAGSDAATGGIAAVSCGAVVLSVAAASGGATAATRGAGLGTFTLRSSARCSAAGSLWEIGSGAGCAFGAGPILDSGMACGPRFACISSGGVTGTATAEDGATGSGAASGGV